MGRGAFRKEVGLTVVRNPEETEQFVRERWENVGIKHYHIDGICYWMVHQNGSGIPLHGYESPELAWAEAAEFTEQRLKEIMKVEEALIWIAWQTRNSLTPLPAQCIIALLNEKLDSLKKEMRP